MQKNGEKKEKGEVTSAYVELDIKLAPYIM